MQHSESAANIVQYFNWNHNQVPRALVTHLSRTTAELWVPSLAAKQAVQRLGYARSVVIMPPPVDDCPLLLAAGDDGTPYILSEGGADQAHAMTELVAAFAAEYGGRIDVRLALLLHHFDRRALRRLQDAILAASATSNNASRIQIITSLPPRARLELFANAAAYVHVARTDAMMLAVRQAIACRLPVTTGFTAAAQELTTNYNSIKLYHTLSASPCHASCPLDPLTGKAFAVQQLDITVGAVRSALAALRSLINIKRAALAGGQKPLPAASLAHTSWTTFVDLVRRRITALSAARAQTF